MKASTLLLNHLQLVSVCTADFYWHNVILPTKNTSIQSLSLFQGFHKQMVCTCEPWPTGLSSHHAPVPCCAISVFRMLLQATPRSFHIHKVSHVHCGQPLLFLRGFSTKMRVAVMFPLTSVGWEKNDKASFESSLHYNLVRSRLPLHWFHPHILPTDLYLPVSCFLGRLKTRRRRWRRPRPTPPSPWPAWLTRSMP